MTDLSILAPLIAGLAVIGAFAGVLAGLLGVGGGIVFVPAFYYVFSAMGYDSPQLMQVCLGTSLAAIIVTSLRSLSSHNKVGAVEWHILRGWGPGIVIGALIGVGVATQLRSGTLQALFGGIGICIGLYMVFGKVSWRLGDEMPKGAFRAIGSPTIGFLSVLMGIGGGSFGVPTMTLFGVPIHRAVAFGVVVCMSLITAPIGAALAHRLDPKPLKRIFGGFLILVALNMLRQVLLV